MVGTLCVDSTDPFSKFVSVVEPLPSLSSSDDVNVTYVNGAPVPAPTSCRRSVKTAARRRGQQVLTTRLEAGERWLQVHRHTRPAVLGVRASVTMVLGMALMMALRRGQVVKGKGAACGLCERAVRGV